MEAGAPDAQTQANSLSLGFTILEIMVFELVKWVFTLPSKPHSILKHDLGKTFKVSEECILFTTKHSH